MWKKVDESERKPPSEEGRDVKSPTRSRRAAYLLVFAGVLLLVASAAVVTTWYLHRRSTDREMEEWQRELRGEWERDPALPGEEAVGKGEGVTRLIIPRLGLDVIVVELESLDDLESLKKGPGHIPGTAYPGEPGNMVISGHRTTYGAPFRNIDRLEPGDEIILETGEAEFVYRVDGKEVVPPGDLSILEQSPEPRVTLTSCHPWYSDVTRIVVTGELVEVIPLAGEQGEE